uniref:EF-hand domain-containing protein n=1 Tax=Lotharella oceanica TaxID=641309 RepID=A0A7S2X8L2_9EUKA|eukprot:CAMPEP_0170173662 /NCGR_PEP_ID=MMETSP0040_2-20121228/6941_1 /TAXON_ID=641309 /ORGANISM="Lotharella oceanica, Strain CCMP622" /LENGTH=247 /DNA_ID=CAMNT_0010414947 /DNA_START=54 /DNA_END=797 /DNA_ORIENTATION=-
MSQSAFEQAVEDFFGYMDRNGDGLVTIREAKDVMRVALIGVLGKDEKVDSKRLEDDVDRQVKLLLSKADFDHDKKISLEEFQTYYSTMVKRGMEPEVLMLDIKKATDVLKAHKFEKSPSQHKKEPKFPESAGLCIVRLAKKSQGNIAGRLKLFHTLMLNKGCRVRVSGSLRGMPAEKTFRMACELKGQEKNMGEFFSDINGSAEVDLDVEMPEDTQVKTLTKENCVTIVDAKSGKLVSNVQILELHK